MTSEIAQAGYKPNLPHPHALQISAAEPQLKQPSSYNPVPLPPSRSQQTSHTTKWHSVTSQS